MHRIIISIIASYLIGSIPTAYIFGRFLKGIDIRNSGSGNVGATNAFRVLGKTVGIAVLLIDIWAVVPIIEGVIETDVIEGAVLSILTSLHWTVSAFPATSTELKHVVVVPSLDIV